MGKMYTKVMMYEIIKPLSCDWNVFGEVLRRIRYESYRIKNAAIQYCYDDDNKRSAFKKIHGRYPRKNEYYGNDITMYDTVKSECVYSATRNMNSAVQKAQGAWNTYKRDVFKRNMSIPSYRPNNPIELNRQCFNSLTIGQATINLLSKEGVEALKRDLATVTKKKKKTGDEEQLKFTPEQLDTITTSFTFAFYPGKNGAKQILQRIVSGEYRLGSSQILYNERKKKWMLALTYSFEPVEEDVDPNRILGVDLGIANVAYMAISDNAKWRSHIGGSEIDVFRRKVEKRRRELQRQAVYCGDGRIGHGRKTRMKPVYVIGDKIARFKDTANHKYARRIVELARQNKCGTIQMEDLSGINERSKFLGSWTYFDLQMKIISKASEYGINVVKIKPNWTSKRCSECGHIDVHNRDIKKDQAKFKCVSCGFEAHADWNAARNIATPYIDVIIKEKCKELGLRYDKEDDWGVVDSYRALTS